MMKKLYLIRVSFSFVITVLLLLTPPASVAEHFLLVFQSPQTIVRVHLSVPLDTEAAQASVEQGLQEQPSGLLPSEDQKYTTVGGLPISEPAPSPPPVRPSDFTSGANDENQEPGAIGGMPESTESQFSDLTYIINDEGQNLGGLPSPVSLHFIDPHDGTASTSSLPLTTQPTAASKEYIRPLQTKSASVSSWLERVEDDGGAFFFEGSPDQLDEFVVLFASLVATEAKEMHSCQPFTRLRSYICDSDVNPRWYRGRIAVLTESIAIAAVTSVGFSMGIPALGGTCLSTGICIPPSILMLSRAWFPNRFQVSFTFRSDNLLMSEEINHLQQIVNLLQCTGGFNLVSFNFNARTSIQTLRFIVQVPDTVHAGNLRGLLERHNQQLTNPFQIKVSAIGEPTTHPVDLLETSL
ncbi:hypothetical protein [Endozoicomonas sp. ALC020]|uniref:hypothetical protein n=1 Tax=unclassified Endozoicomonas TaxID=2644528 RepID=UPI003BB1B2B1